MDDVVLHEIHPLYNVLGFGGGLTGVADSLGFGFLAFATLSLQDCQNCCSRCTAEAKVNNKYCLSSKHMSVH